MICHAVLLYVVLTIFHENVLGIMGFDGALAGEGSQGRGFFILPTVRNISPFGLCTGVKDLESK